MESIDKGNPIILFYDPYYISIRQDAYNKRHMMHSVLVNGYSKEDKLVYVLEHKNWESLFYEQVTISFREIEDAYQFGTSENEGDFTYYDFHVNESIPITQGVLRKKYCNMIYENKEVILKGIENFKLFLNDYEKIVFEEPKRKETYEKFLEVFSRIINTKRVEQQRIDYLFGKNSEHSKIIEEIVNLWERVRTYIGRYIFSGKYSNKDMTKSIDLLKEIIFEEENFFNAFTPNL